MKCRIMFAATIAHEFNTPLAVIQELHEIDYASKMKILDIHSGENKKSIDMFSIVCLSAAQNP